MKTTLYEISHPDGWLYVGTTVKPKARWQQHRHDLERGRGVLFRAGKADPAGWKFRALKTFPDREAAFAAEVEAIAALPPDWSLNRHRGGLGGQVGPRPLPWRPWIETLSIPELAKLGRHLGWDKGSNRTIDIDRASEVIGRRIPRPRPLKRGWEPRRAA